MTNRPHSTPAPQGAAKARSGSALVGVLRRWRWADTALGLLLGLTCLVYMGGPLAPGGFEKNWLPPLAYNILQFGLPIVFAVRLADEAVERGRAAPLAYGAAVSAVVLSGVFVTGPALMPWLGTDPHWTIAHDLWLMIGVGVPLALGTAAYARWRAAQRSRALQRGRETERAQAQQQLQAARLLALQARVAPQRLFDTLSEVGRLIDAGQVEAALLQLEALITLLRGLSQQATLEAPIAAHHADRADR